MQSVHRHVVTGSASLVTVDPALGEDSEETFKEEAPLPGDTVEVEEDEVRNWLSDVGDVSVDGLGDGQKRICLRHRRFHR